MYDPRPLLESGDAIYHCSRCGAPVGRMVQIDPDTRTREVFSCSCGEAMEFLHPPVTAELPLGGWGLEWAHSIALQRWRARPTGVKRYPPLARLMAPKPRQTIESWTWDGADW